MNRFERGITEIGRNEAECTEAHISTIFQEGPRWFKSSHSDQNNRIAFRRFGYFNLNNATTETEQICEANMQAFAIGITKKYRKTKPQTWFQSPVTQTKNAEYATACSAFFYLNNKSTEANLRSLF